MVLKARYCIVEKIGQGGDGSLYLARDLDLGMTRAIKEIPIKKKREAKLLRLLEHPMIPRMVDYLERDEYCYVVMEYIKGGSLADALKEKRHFTTWDGINLAISVCQVFTYLHQQKPPIYYGDLKPENLMLTPQGNLYLVDLGSAVQNYDNRKKTLTGTHGYAAPEQLEGRISEKSDIYALGKTMLSLYQETFLRDFFKKPQFFLILFRCCASNESLRYKDMKSVEIKLQQLKQKRKHVHWPIVGIALVLLVGVAVMRTFSKTSKETFAAKLTSVTAPFYEEQFWDGSEKMQKEQFQKAEKKLQKLLQIAVKEEEIQRVLLMLALGGELKNEWKRAAIYYEQLLMYQEACPIVYGEYGCFLRRMNEKEEARELFAMYQEAEEKEMFQDNSSRNLSIWKQFCSLYIDPVLNPDEKRRIREEKKGRTLISDTVVMRLQAGFGMELGGFDLEIGEGTSYPPWPEEDNAEYPIPENIMPENSIPENNSVQDITPESSPGQSITSTNNPVQDITPENGPGQSITSTNSPVQDITPENSPVQSIIPTNSPVQDIIPENSPGQRVIPASSPVQSIIPESNPVQSNVPASSPVQSNIPESSLSQKSVPERISSENKEGKTTQIPTHLTIKKVQLYAAGSGPLHLHIVSDGPVHIWGLRINSIESFWQYESDGISVNIENTNRENNENQIQLILAYESDTDEPIINI